MGYWRKLAAGTLLLTFGSSVVKAGDPLIVTKLADAETQLLAPDGSLVNPSPEQRNADFINALVAASAARERAIDEQCRDTQSVPEGREARMTWEAKCRYRRR